MGQEKKGGPNQSEMSIREKLKFIRKRLDEIPEQDSPEGRGGLWIKLLHPEVLIWTPNSFKEKVLPPREGKLKDLVFDRNLPPYTRRGQPTGIMLDFTNNSHLTGVDYAVFGLGALEISEKGEMTINCTRLEKPRSFVQSMLPNLFVDRISNLRTA